MHNMYNICCNCKGPIEFMEPDLSRLPVPQPVTPDNNEKRDSISSDKQRQGRLLGLE